MKKLIFRRKVPLPAGRMLIPSIIALWNKCKGPIDVYSRFLCDSKGKYKKLSANGKVWNRAIMTCFYNTYKSYVLFHTRNFLNSPECKTYMHFQRALTKFGISFESFLLRLSNEVNTEVTKRFFRSSDKSQ
jgi:hypothetical protein